MPLNIQHDGGASASSPDDLLLPATVAVLLALTTKTLEQWRWRGIGPRFLKLGRLVRYRRSDVDAWLAERVCASTRDGLTLPRASEASTPTVAN